MALILGRFEDCASGTGFPYITLTDSYQNSFAADQHGEFYSTYGYVGYRVTAHLSAANKVQHTVTGAEMELGYFVFCGTATPEKPKDETGSGGNNNTCCRWAVGDDPASDPTLRQIEAMRQLLRASSTGTDVLRVLASPRLRVASERVFKDPVVLAEFLALLGVGQAMLAEMQGRVGLRAPAGRVSAAVVERVERLLPIWQKAGAREEDIMVLHRAIQSTRGRTLPEVTIDWLASSAPRRVKRSAVPK